MRDCRKGVSKALLITLQECTKIAIRPITRIGQLIATHSSEYTMIQHLIRQGASRFRKQLNTTNSLGCKNLVFGVCAMNYFQNWTVHNLYNFFSSS